MEEGTLEKNHTDPIGVPHKIVSFGHWLTHIRVQDLVLGSTKLACNIWPRVESLKTATLYMLNHVKVLQSNLAQP